MGVTVKTSGPGPALKACPSCHSCGFQPVSSNVIKSSRQD